MRKKRIIILLIAGLAVLAGSAIGVMAVTGVFRSDKAEVRKLLAQVPERLSWFSTGEVVGFSEMQKAMYEKGSSTEISLKDIKIKGLEDMVGEEAAGFLNGLSAGYSIHTSAEGRCLMSLKAEKNQTPVTVNYYVDGENPLQTIYLSAPELLAAKVFKVDMREKDGNAKIDIATLKKFYGDAAEFIAGEAAKVWKDIHCDKIENGGYRLMIPRKSLDMVLDDMLVFMEGQTQLVECIDEMAKMPGLEDEEGDFDIYAEMKKGIDELKQKTSDISFQVYGKEGNITAIKTVDTKIAGKDVELSLEFTGQKDESAVVLKLNSGETAAALTMKDEKKEKYTTSVSLDMNAGSELGMEGTVSCSETVTVDPSDNSCEIQFDIDGKPEAAGELENVFPIHVTAKGFIKDIKKGSYADYVMDDVVVSVGGEEVCTMSLDVKSGVQEGEVKPLEGEEVEIKLYEGEVDDILNKYQEELMMSLSTIIVKWGIGSYSSGMMAA